MEEKAKRKEKPKNKLNHEGGSAPFWVASLFLLMLFLMGVGMMVYLLLQPSDEEIAFRETTTSIVMTNAAVGTYISSSSTAAVANASATAFAPTRRVELRLTTTAHVQLSETSAYQTEVVRATLDAQDAVMEAASSSTAAYLIPIVSETAAIEDMTATENALLNQRATATALSYTFNPTVSPTAGNCGFAVYSGLVESSYASEEWQRSLDAANVDYRSARVLYDAFEAQNDCQGGLIPLPFECQVMEVSLEINETDWLLDERRVSRLYPVLESMQTAGICEGAEVELRVYFFLSETDFRYWAIGRETALEAYQNAVDAEALWALGTMSED